MEHTIDYEYLEYLLSLVDIRHHIDYTLVCVKLYDTPYYPQELTWDKIRCQKAIELRAGEFERVSRPLSCLEILISIAFASESVMKDGTNNVSTWFWIMIENLGLCSFFDAAYDSKSVNDILDKFVNRKYAKNGKGSIAYTRNDNIDFRKLDLWNQFAIYLSENYVIGKLI